MRNYFDKFNQTQIPLSVSSLRNYFDKFNQPVIAPLQ